MLRGSEPAPLVRSQSDFQQDWACARLRLPPPRNQAVNSWCCSKNTIFSHQRTSILGSSTPLQYGCGLKCDPAESKTQGDKLCVVSSLKLNGFHSSAQKTPFERHGKHWKEGSTEIYFKTLVKWDSSNVVALNTPPSPAHSSFLNIASIHMCKSLVWGGGSQL